MLGLGPVGQLATRVAHYLGIERVIGVDRVPERRAAAARFGIDAVDPDELDDIPGALIEMTGGRGPDAVIDAVGMEAHGHTSPRAPLLPRPRRSPPGCSRPGREKVGDQAGLDRMDALHTAIKAVRRGGTVSVSGVYGGEADPMPMMEMFDRGIQLRMGQAHVRRWIDDLLPIVSDDRDPLGVREFATHHLPLEDAPRGYEIFRDKSEGCLKVVLQP